MKLPSQLPDPVFICINSSLFSIRRIIYLVSHMRCYAKRNKLAPINNILSITVIMYLMIKKMKKT